MTQGKNRGEITETREREEVKSTDRANEGKKIQEDSKTKVEEKKKK